MLKHRGTIRFAILLAALLCTLCAGWLLAADIDEDGLDDAWEVTWFGTIELYGPADDPDRDGLSNEIEYGIDSVNMSPAHWDSDGDLLDDAWEYIYGLYDPAHLDPVNASDITLDYDGDGLSTWQEYCGVDGHRRLVTGGSAAGGVVFAKTDGTDDDLNPLDIDSDFDLLLDSYEAAWYDPENNIDPNAGAGKQIPLRNDYDTSIAREDSDRDGLSNYREQCLLAEFREGAVNEHIWVWEERVPFPIVTYTATLSEGETTVRVCLFAFVGGAADLDLDLVMDQTIPSATNRFQLRNEEWTDPTEGTGYFYVDEDIPAGHDSDDDMLPDGWEVEFGLDPRDAGLAGSWDDGPFGDPDNDGIWNLDEYLGQDGNRFTTDPYINGTGDETNPNRHFWRPDSTYTWRWLPDNLPLSYLTDARNGTGISRIETLGAGLPTAPLASGINTYTNLGYDEGLDSDDDGLSDYEEINAPLLGSRPSSPVHSCSPFVPKSVLIKDAAGIQIPDPEPAEADGFRPAGLREDLQGRDWTVECQVKLLASGLSGDLFRFETRLGGDDLLVCSLSLSNNVPLLVAQNNNALSIATVAANEIPTNQWVHIAGVWNQEDNSLSLYIHGILQQGRNLFGESAAAYYSPATNDLALAVSPDGSFVDNLLLDEVRIWGVARDGALINRFSGMLAPQSTGDDVWLNSDSKQYYADGDSVLVNGGTLFEGEPGTLLEHVYSYENSFWIDNGDGQFNNANDILLKRDFDSLREGAVGTAVGNCYYNDKDGSGGFTARSLLAYYRFDDGGQTAEDFARKAKSGLMATASESHSFGDFGYALTTNSFEWVASDPAPVLGVHPDGADDSDNDGMPDSWEVINHLDPNDDGSGGESSPGAKDGPYGPLGDHFDGDGLANLYEFYSRSNPLEFDTDGDSSPDTQDDLDGDGVVNGLEQQLGSRPDLVDTDDDGLTDSEEQALGTDPANATSPSASYSLDFGGSADDFAQVPASINQRLQTWTIEAWVKPDSVGSSDQIVLRRAVEDLAGGTNALNYVLGLRPQGGALVLFAGYVDLDGDSHILEQGEVAVGEWTHIAASYDLLSATCSTYTNGVVVTNSSSFYTAPPINGKGGDTFTRIGENFDGMIDDLRLWQSSRTALEIADNYERAIAVDADLAHYFRFDDNQADEDIIAFGEFHQPQGAQDFVYPKDWNEQWVHAARFNGSVQFTADSPIVTPSSLQILIRPEDAVNAGALWSLDGGSWNESGETLTGLEAGTHTLAFKSINGWTAPAVENISISNSTETILQRTYLQNGSLTVSLEPIDAVDEGAAWRIEGGEWQGSDATITNLSPDAYYIEFESIEGWDTPAVAPVVLDEAEDLSLTRFYTPIEGTIEVVIEPQAAADDGAQWRVNGAAWLDSGQQSGPLPYGSHVVEFSDLAQWITPTNMTVSIVDSGTTSVTGRYTQTTGIYLEFSPGTIAASGAVWRVDGGEWLGDKTLAELSAGEHTVEFGDVDGWTTPATSSVTVSNDITTSILASYYRVNELGEFGTGGVPGLLNSPRGLDIDSAGRLYVADTDNHCIQVYDPATHVWLAPIGGYGSAAGSFNQPVDVFLDGSDNIYVADTGNNRIQKRSAGSGAWTVWGGTAAGDSAGEFDGPFGVAADGLGNVYVADLYNHRVQKRSPAGVWSTIIASGLAGDQTRYPRDLQILPGGTILLADHITSPAMARVREFSATGDMLGTVGSGETERGGLGKVGSIHVDGADIYLADMLSNRVALGNTGSGDWSNLMQSDTLNGPEGVVYSATDGLFVADTGNNRILQLDLSTMAVAPPGYIALSISAILAGEEDISTGGMTIQGGASLADAPRAAIRISWNSDTNTAYRVQRIDPSDRNPAWGTISGTDPIDGAPGATSFIDTNISNRVKLYRIIKD